MLGTSHAASGLAVGAATLPLAAHAGAAGWAAQLGWVAAVGGMAMLPDLDQGGVSMKGGQPAVYGSTVARMWGPVTIGAAALIGKVARGHRQGTHDVLLAPVVFGAAAWAASLTRPTSALAVAFAVGLALQALHVVIPGRAERTVIGNVLMSAAAGWALVYWQDVDLAWLPWAVAAGVVVHIAGDWLTVGGVPVPLTWTGGRGRRVAAGLFKTGAGVETVLAVAFAVTAALLLVLRFDLAARAATWWAWFTTFTT